MNEEAPLPWQERAPLRGCAAGGCLVPLLAFIACMDAGDTGGPFFWPFFMATCGFVGWVIGIAIKSNWRQRHPH